MQVHRFQLMYGLVRLVGSGLMYIIASKVVTLRTVAKRSQDRRFVAGQSANIIGDMHKPALALNPTTIK